MKFLCLDKPAKKEGTPPTQQKMDQMGELIEVWMKSGCTAGDGRLPAECVGRPRAAVDWEADIFLGVAGDGETEIRWVRAASVALPQMRGHAGAQYPSFLFTIFFSGSPFSNRAYCSRKKRMASSCQVAVWSAQCGESRTFSRL